VSKKNGDAAKQSDKYIEIGNWFFYKISEDKYESIDCYGHIDRITPEFKSEVSGRDRLKRAEENKNFWEFSIFYSIEATGSFEVVSDYIKNRN
jgi:hypothetical protein